MPRPKKRGPKKGSIKTIEHRQKISVSCMGLKDSDETKKKKSNSAIGNKNARSGYKELHRLYLNKAKQTKRKIISIRKISKKPWFNKKNFDDLKYLKSKFKKQLDTLRWLNRNKKNLKLQDTIKEIPSIGDTLFSFENDVELIENTIADTSIISINPETFLSLSDENILYSPKFYYGINA